VSPEEGATGGFVAISIAVFPQARKEPDIEGLANQEHYLATI
jgi:hypothetical protein